MKKFNDPKARKPYKRFDRPRNFQPRPAIDYNQLTPDKVDTSRAMAASFSGRSVSLRPNEDIENAIKRFKRTVEASGVLAELKRREFYRAPAIKAKEKSAKAQKRARKNKPKFFDKD